jgi:hypothetical protein
MILTPVELQNLEGLEFDEDDYRQSERAILENLLDALTRLKGQQLDASKESAKIQVAIDALKDKLGKFNSGDFSSFSENPRLWQNTSRLAPKMTTATSEKTSAFEFVDTVLKSFSTRDFIFNRKLRRAWSEIKSAKTKHIQVRKNAKRHFLYQAKNALAANLSTLLKSSGYQENIHDPSNLLTRLEKIKQLKSRDETNENKIEGDFSIIETRKECLVANLEIHKITQEIKKLHGIENNNIHSLATQLDEITKRWIDPHFMRPSKLTTFDKVREAIKIVTVSLGGVLAAASLIFLFTPLAPLSPLLGLAAMVCMAPFLDTIISAIYCKIRYARNVLKSQLTEMILMPIVGVVMWSIGHIASLFHAFKVIWNAINSYGMNALMSVSNPVYAFLMGRPLTKVPVLSKEDLEKHAVVSQEEAIKMIKKTETPNKRIRLSSAAHSLWSENQKKSHGFIFKTSEGVIHYEESHHPDLNQWLMTEKKIKCESLTEIKAKVDNYLNISSGVSFSQRSLALDEIASKVSETENVKNKDSILSLIKILEKEKAQLEKIHNTLSDEHKERDSHLILSR